MNIPELVFATNNRHKLDEVQQYLGNKVRLLTLEDIGCLETLPETSSTIEGNASQKAWHVYKNYGYDCFADDTGLEVSSLKGAPGVHSARYAGPNATHQENTGLLLKNLEEMKDRSARFKTVISLIVKGSEQLFEGVVNGNIRETPSGKKGFGYDPVFEPDGYHITFAEMSMEEKNTISHRGKAVQKLVEWLVKNAK